MSVFCLRLPQEATLTDRCQVEPVDFSHRTGPAAYHPVHGSYDVQSHDHSVCKYSKV